MGVNLGVKVPTNFSTPAAANFYEVWGVMRENQKKHEKKGTASGKKRYCKWGKKGTASGKKRYCKWENKKRFSGEGEMISKLNVHP